MDTRALLDPKRLWSRAEVLASPSPVPRCAGVYAWFFRQIPPRVPTEDCIVFDGLTLLYVGISPKAPPLNGRPPSRQNLRTRLCYHMRGNAEGSTLRLTLGVLLGLELRRVGSGKRLTFAAQEAELSAWMADNSRVTWMEHPEPWRPETELLNDVPLPLNLDQNRHNPFHTTLTALRRDAKNRAQALPIE